MTTDQPTTPAETVEAAIAAARPALSADELQPLGIRQEATARLLVEHLGLTLDQARRAAVLANAASPLAALSVQVSFAEIGRQVATAMRGLGGAR